MAINCIHKEYRYGDDGIGGPEIDGEDLITYYEWAVEHIQDLDTAAEIAAAWISRHNANVSEPLDVNDDPREGCFERYTVINKDEFMAQLAEVQGR
jgi:hypothetical protein